MVLRLRQPPEVTLEVVVGEVARVDPKNARSAHVPAGDKATELQASQGLPNSGRRGLEQASELTRIALLEQTKSQENAGSRPAAKGRGFADHHR